MVALFLGALLLVRGPFYVAAMIGAWGNGVPGIPPIMIVFAMLSAPPVLAVAVTLACRRSLRDFGWKPGRPRYLLLGWAGPIGVALAVYGAAWAAGLIAPAPGRTLDAQGMLWATVGTTLGLAIPTLLFEELGWRGFLVPHLARRLSFTRVALVSGAIWALFHYPFLLHPAYAHRPPTVTSVAAFTVGIMAASFPLAWLRLRSGSVWPAVLFHAAHNAFVNQVLSRGFRPTGALGAAIVGESGVGLAVGYALLAWWAWRHRGELPRPVEEEHTTASHAPAG